MNAVPHTTLMCPYCFREFRAAAWRVLTGASITCRHCARAMTVASPEQAVAPPPLSLSDQEARALAAQLRELLKRLDRTAPPDRTAQAQAVRNG